MVGVTKKEVSQMTKYYLKMDNIMKNMFVVALNDELQAQSEQDECLEETKALLKKVSEYDLAQKRLQITAGEQRQIRKALNRLRSKYLAAGRYSDGIRWMEKRVCRRDWKELCSMWMMQASLVLSGTTAEVSH